MANRKSTTGFPTPLKLRPYGGIEMCVLLLLLLLLLLYIVSRNNTDVAHYNFNAHQPMLVIFGRYIAERIFYQMVILILGNVFCTTCANINMDSGNCVFLVMLYTLSQKRHCFGLLYLRHSWANFNNFCIQGRIIKYSVQILFLTQPFRFRDTVYSMTEKTQFPGFMFPQVVQRQ